MLRPLSVQRPYTAFFSGDPAIIPAPPEPAKDADEETKKTYERQKKEHARLLELALATSQWQEICVPGDTITTFKLRPLKTDEYGALCSMLVNRVEQPFEVWKLAFQLALQDCSPLLDGVEVKFTEHPRWGRIATTSFLDEIGLKPEVGAMVVMEIGQLVYKRSRDLDSKQ